jgi:DNA-binding CsgD family transcriptional regulator/tetratricopeptide (TPR) repeat protein
LAYRHGLVRWAVYDNLPPAVGRALHRHAARILLSRGESVVDVARHLESGAGDGDPEGLQALEDAARGLMNVSLTAAVRLAANALALTGRQVAGRARRAALLVQALGTSGDTGDAIAVADSELGPPRAGWEDDAQLRYQRVNAIRFTNRFRATIDASEDELRRPAIDGANRASLLALRAFAASALQPPDDARRLVEEAREAADRSGDHSSRQMAHAALALVELQSGHLDRALDIHLQAAEQTASRGRGSAPPPGLLGPVVDLLALDRPEDAGRALNALDGSIPELGGWGRSAVRLLRARALLGTGRLGGALAEAHAGASAARELARSVDELQALDLELQIRFRIGGMAAAHGRWPAVRAAVPDEDAAAWGLDFGGLLFASVGIDPSAARSRELRERFNRVIPAISDRFFLLAVQPWVAPHVVKAAVELNAPDEATLVVGRARLLASMNPHVSSIVAAAMHAEGVLLDDIRALDRARRIAATSPQPLLLADAASDLGWSLARSGDRAAGIARLEQALGVYVSCGADADAARVKEHLRRLGVRPGPVRRGSRPATGWKALTESELAVVQLVIQGRTNREVANRLFISPHTVDSHLRHAFQKLDISSRVQLTRVALATDQSAAGN